MLINDYHSHTWKIYFTDKTNNAFRQSTIKLDDGFLGQEFWQELALQDKQQQYIDKKNSQDCTINQFIVMLGSNYHAKINLIKAIQLLHFFLRADEIAFGNYIISQDYTGKSLKSYHNQVLKINLKQPLALSELEEILKKIEQLCGRNQQKKYQDKHPKDKYLVALDLDILAVACSNQWYKLHERFPLKQHERDCLGLIANTKIVD